MASALKRISVGKFVFGYITLPLLVILVLLNLLYWNNISAVHKEEINTFSTTKQETLSALFLSSLNRTRILWDQNSIIEERIKKGIASDLNQTEASQQYATEEARLLRLSTENLAAVELDKFIRSHNEFEKAFVTDNIGDIVAATEMESKLNHAPDEWWRKGMRLAPGEFNINNISEQGSCFVSFPVYENPEKDPIGLLHIRWNIKTLMEKLNITARPNRAALIRGIGIEFNIGTQAFLSKFKGPIEYELENERREAGYRQGAWFNTVPMPEPFDFDQRLKMTSVLEAPPYPPEAGRKMVLSLLASIMGLFLFTLKGFSSAHKIGANNLEWVDAGKALLHRIRANKQGGASLPHSTRAMQQEFDQWLAAYKESAIQNIEIKEHEQDRDLALAKEFQMAYLNRPYPPVPERPIAGRLQIKIHHYYKPAMALGGDFFDVVRLGPETMGLCIADVMGHGARSALITATLRAMLNDLSDRARNPRNLLSELNHSFCDLIKQVHLNHPLFASCFYFVADTKARAATYATAGHPPGFHLERPTNRVRRMEVEQPHGAALGINPKETYTGGACRLNPGDVFFFFTDGLYEAFSASGQEFGIDRIEQTLRSLMHATPEEMLNGLVEAVNDFTGNEPVHDDICLVLLEVAES